ncbi:MAG: RlmE family RNA methyltransferase [Deltaproteobacteria bacterium]|nr:RlmE family RNA methyltransferase [Deltaproteobacteria bacterium]
MKAKRGKNKWQDHYARRAKQEKYLARSVYKLEEIQQKSWLQYAAGLVGEKGVVVGIDLIIVKAPMPKPVCVYSGDIFDEAADFWEKIGGGYHAVLSDMAPDTTGNRFVDTARSFRLCQAALGVARDRLRPGGSFVCKIFQGEDFQEMVRAIRGLFKRYKIFKPKSCRKMSKEIYVIGMDRK